MWLLEVFHTSKAFSQRKRADSNKRSVPLANSSGFPSGAARRGAGARFRVCPGVGGSGAVSFTLVAAVLGTVVSPPPQPPGPPGLPYSVP